MTLISIYLGVICLSFISASYAWYVGMPFKFTNILRILIWPISLPIHTWKFMATMHRQAKEEIEREESALLK